MKRQRVIFVMHQMPFTINKIGPNTQCDPNQNHLAQFSGSQALEKDYDVVYVGSELGEHSAELKKSLWDEKKAFLIELDHVVSQGHYEGYCKSGNGV
jgi:trehalose-6-phosphate synthase